MALQITPLIMCGGAGTRLWPASRENRPKQFLPLFGSSSTFQETVRRVSNPLFTPPIVITNCKYRFLVQEQLEAIGTRAEILLEPLRRDSGPAILAGSLVANKLHGGQLVLALAADHVIKDAEAFVAACSQAVEAALDDRIVTFGVKPTRPATEYGYVKGSDPITSHVLAVREFVEKPNYKTAERYVTDGFLWNSGNFLFRSEVLLAEYSAFDSKSAAAVRKAVELAAEDNGFITMNASALACAPTQSIDYAVMERTSRAAVIPVSYDWSDVGSWHAVWELSPHNPHGNAACGPSFFLKSENNYVSSEKQLVALVGVEDLTVVASADAVLVSRRQDTGELKEVVAKIKDLRPHLTEDHPKVHRPWGSYQSLDQGDRFQVKRIIVKQGGRLSLQMHHHRAEHWIVVRGTARVTIGQNVRLLHENESVYVPIGTPHRLENPGKIELELVEVQTGSYLGEDDIVRLQDDYRRD